MYECELRMNVPLIPHPLVYNAIVAERKHEYLHIFSIQLFIQWETLDYPLVTGMESTQLYPLVGGIPANRAMEK